MCLVGAPEHGGAVATRNFIPKKVHKAIGVFGAVSVATAVAYPSTVASEVAGGISHLGSRTIQVEHPTGFFTVEMLLVDDGGKPRVRALRLAAHGARADDRRRTRPHRGVGPRAATGSVA